MTLTAEERRRLRRIAVVLAREDPDLAAALRLPLSRRSAGGRMLVWSATILLAGALTQQPPVCVTGWLGLLVGALIRYV